MTAGIEGGSKRRIEEDLGLQDYAELRAYWGEHPPPHFTIQLIAARLGINLEELRPKSEAAYGEIEPQGGLSIAELAAAIKPPAPGEETLGASIEIIRLMTKESADGGER